MVKKYIALLLLLIGLVGYYFFSSSSSAGQSSAEKKQACQIEILKRYNNSVPPELKGKCDEASFAAMITASSAQDAAQSVSAANQAEVGSNMTGMAFLGLAIVGALGLVLSFLKKK